MPKNAAAISINLVPEDPFYETPAGKILRWALSVGRYIVIFTELVVILSFVARFTLDRQITDLNESINQKTSIIQSYGNLENDVRLYQEKIEQYTQVQQQTNIADVFAAISRITPQAVELEQLRIQQAEVSFTGTTPSQSILNTLLSNLTLSPAFTEVNVPSIGTAEDGQAGFAFTVTATLDAEALSSGAVRGAATDVERLIEADTTDTTDTIAPAEQESDG